MKEELNEGLLFALEEMAKEQKEGNVSLGLLTKAVENFSDRLTEMEMKIENQKPPEVDTKPVTDLLKVYFGAIKNIIESQPKNVTHTKRVQLFPVESFKRDFYLKVIGMILKWAVILTIALVLVRRVITFV
ncbi:hypothetical protein ABDK00_010955 [Niabella insulamsoli]|uniref:hypothetical protein n=1 Tax=Niabella insulamsoli TaxID=3144874 RepID=UPI0031FE1C01